MHGIQKSDELIVPMKLRTVKGRRRKLKGQRPEYVEGRGSSLAVLDAGHHCRYTEDRMIQMNSESDAMQRVKALANANKNLVFNNLMHLATLQLFMESLNGLNHYAAPGVDGVTLQDYMNSNPKELLPELREEMFNGSYRASPTRRVYIPKPDGGERPLGIATVRDKVAQTVIKTILEAVFEPIFKDFSYGFRPGRNAHQALDELSVCIMRQRVLWILDADISKYFDTIPHELMVECIKRRVSDPRILRLIRKWLKAGIFDKGKLTDNVVGTPQGAPLSPLLANIFLHYALDEWADEWRKSCKGYMCIVRYADDFILGFECKSEAERFLEDLKARLEEHGLGLSPTKTRLINFGRSAMIYRENNGLPKPESFDFLGFRHICAKSKTGHFKVLRKTIGKRLSRKLKEIKGFLKMKMHEPIKEIVQTLNRKLMGYYRYFAYIDNVSTLKSMKYHLLCYWRKIIGRRSQLGWRSPDFRTFFKTIAPLVAGPSGDVVRLYPDTETIQRILNGANAKLRAGC